MITDENELATAIIGEAIEVHRRLGPGLLESPYEELLCHRLIAKGFIIERQKPIPLVIDGEHRGCGFRCDIIVNNAVIVEVKSIEVLANIHTAQVLTYLRITDLKLGLILNFNVTKLKNGIKRVVNNL